MDSTDRRGTWAIVLVVLLVLFLLLSRCSGSGGSTRVGAVPNGAGPAEPAPAPTATRGSSAGDDENSDDDASDDGERAARSGTLTVDGNPVNGNLIPLTGKRAVARNVRVLTVPADEGFWIGTGSSDRIWVQLTGPPPESPYTVRSGDQVSFAGRITRNRSGFARAVGVTRAEGAATLNAQRRHLSVPKRELSLQPS